MPVRRFEPNVSSEHATLVDQLAREWTSPAVNATEPLILEEFDRTSRLSRVYVVWSQWSGIDRAERSEIIMDAAEKTLGPSKALDITVAMGLEPAEARRMGLKF
jgi:hypothetical protein